MKNSIGVIVIVLVGLAIVFALRSSTEDRSGANHYAVGRPLTVTLEPLTGTDVPISDQDLAGKVTLINYWGTWCGPCLAEFPHIVEIHRQFGGEEDFALVSVSVPALPSGDEQQLANSTQAFLDKMGADFVTYSDPTGASRQALAMTAELFSGGVPGTVGVPVTVVLDRDGIIRGLWLGFRPRYTAQMEALLTELF